MNNNKSSMALNLSNQANLCKSRNSSLSQLNYFVILGFEFLDVNIEQQTEPRAISIDINKLGELTINGVDGEIIDDNNILIYSDKKVTDSNK